MLQFSDFQETISNEFPDSTFRCDISSNIYAADVDGSKWIYGALDYNGKFTIQVKVYPHSQNEEWSILFDKISFKYKTYEEVVGKAMLHDFSIASNETVLTFEQFKESVLATFPQKYCLFEDPLEDSYTASVDTFIGIEAFSYLSKSGSDWIWRIYVKNGYKFEGPSLADVILLAFAHIQFASKSPA